MTLDDARNRGIVSVNLKPINSEDSDFCGELTSCVQRKKMSPSAAERYAALMSPTHVDDTGDATAWKELAKLNMRLGFDIGRADFPQRATDTLLQKAGGHVSRNFQKTEEIVNWVEAQATRANPNTSSLANQPLPAKFGENVKLFFLNMQSLLKDGHLIRQEPSDFWPWFIAVLQSLGAHAGGGAQHGPTAPKTLGHPPTPAHAPAHAIGVTPTSASVKIPPHAIPYGHGQCMLGFYYPGQDAEIDKLCQVPFLGNFWQAEIIMKYVDRNGHKETFTFSNAEAAFQAFKFPIQFVARFQGITGDAAFQLKNNLDAHKLPNNQYQGYASNWHCMTDVLKCKFEQNPDLSEKLKQTHPCFLLEHNDRCNRDTTWSDNCDGRGQNWLGLQLMLLRETLLYPKDFQSQQWHQFIAGIGNKQPGFPKTFQDAKSISSHEDWFKVKKEAYCAMSNALKHTACGANCNKKPLCS